ncbi:MAG: hypothetical protein WCJ37_02220 [Syntrophus sp. (in: bacteria)]
MNYSENISINVTQRMRNELEHIGNAEEKKLSHLIREILFQGIRERTIDCLEHNTDDLEQ